jgi:hypothetical protein
MMIGVVSSRSTRGGTITRRLMKHGFNLHHRVEEICGAYDSKCANTLNGGV